MIYHFIIIILIRPILPNLYIIMYGLHVLDVLWALLPGCAFLFNKILLLPVQVIRRCWILTVFFSNLSNTEVFLWPPHAGGNGSHYSRQVEAALSAKLASQLRCLANSLYLLLHNVTVPLQLESCKFLAPALVYEHGVSASLRELHIEWRHLNVFNFCISQK
jgi:hypothetical protein